MQMCEINFQATEAEKKPGGVSQETGESGRNDGNSGWDGSRIARRALRRHRFASNPL